MAISQPARSYQRISIGKPSPRRPWLLWIVVNTGAATVAAIVAWQIHSLNLKSADFQGIASFLSAVLVGLFVGGGQWLVLRRSKEEYPWWIPATIGGNVVATQLILPSVLSLVVRLDAGGNPLSDIPVLLATISVMTPALVVGVAQALVLWGRHGAMALFWIVAALIGGGLAVAIGLFLSPRIVDAAVVYKLPISLGIGLLAAEGALALSACQAPVLRRLLR